MLSFNELRKQIKMPADPTYPVIRIGIAGDSPTQFLNQALRGYGRTQGVTFDILEADIDQIDQQILIPGSELNLFKPHYILVFESVYILRDKFYGLNPTDRISYAESYSDRLRSLYHAAAANGSKMICFSFPIISDGVFGNYGYKTKLSFTTQLTRINTALADLGAELKDLFIIDTAALAAWEGIANITQRSVYINNGLLYQPDFFAIIAKHITDQVLAVTGRFKKCLILDLDNTTWGGIIGDDGIENIQIGTLGSGKAFTELQKWAKQLKERGIILAICSKNTESVAMEPFEKHPDMVLRLNDIAVFVANWETKVDNIRHIQSILNIGFDSMVFIDDNPFERNIVRSSIPDITVPELPEEPEEYLPFIISQNLFETASISEGDENRTAQYQEEAKRASLQKSFTNEDEFLESLDMVSVVRPFDKFNIPRVAQLTQRSNQFNLRTIRYTEEDTARVSASGDHITLTFTLEDKFGDSGLIAIIILEKGKDALFIDTWLMSCRVLKRGMENFTLNTIAGIARREGFTKVVGEYIPTKKNLMVQDHYRNLGFVEEDGKWILDINNYIALPNKITPKP
jgi:FkbH-like protein